MDFSSRIKELRLEHKLTQEQFGEKINVTKVSISGYESGNRKPDMETLQKIADLFNESVDYLLGRTDTRKNSSSKNSDSILTDPDVQFIARSKSEMTPKQFQRMMELARMAKEMAEEDDDD